jgi:subtilisin family serine protease
MRRAPWILLLLVLCLAPALQLAPTQAVIAAQPQQHYIVQLAGQAIAVASDSLGQAKNSKLNSQAPAIKHYKNALAQSRRSSLQQIQQLLGHTPPILASYDTVFHGVLLELSAQEAQQIKQIPSVLKVYRDQAHQLSSDSGPRLIGANSIHQASTTGFFAATLLAQNLAIPTNSTLTGRAQLRLDPNSQQLQINIQLNGSAGTAQLIRLHDSSILASLPSNNSNSYQNSITLSTSDQNLLHHDGLFLRINTAQHPNGAIGGVVSGYRGEGVVIGVIDSGINMQHPSFAEIGGDGYRHLNPNGQGNFLGACNPSNPYHHPSIICNNKLIGAWTFERNAAVRNPANNAPSPHDDNGHGSHTASTAAGNILYNLDYDGVHYAQIAGVAPHANIIAYDVCGYYQNGNYTSNCLSSSILAAIEQATLDGVDVINHSISGGTDPWNDPIEQAFLAARQAGIVVSAAAGNNGPLAGSVNHISPWLLSVAASTHDRSYSKELLNIKSASTNYGSITGVGRSATIDNNTTIIYAADISPANTTCDSFDNSQASQIAGKIVLCDYGNNSQFAKAQNALQAGAAGLIIANNSSQGDTLIDIDYPLPSIQISYNHGQQLKAWLNQGQTLSAQINATHNSIKPSNADRMGYFSAQGPSQAPYQNLLKPDLSAPGVAILAASAHSNSASIDLMQSNGTSMAAPHVAGAAALLIGLHPDWSAGEIQSALMLSATPALQNYNSGPANAFARGSGRIQIDQAAAAGLVLDETIEQFQQANPAQGGDPRNLNLANLIDSQCAGACSWVRTFRNTHNHSMHWQISSSDPALSITPSSFSIAANSSQSISFRYDTSAKTLGNYHFAQITLSSDQAPSLQLPVAVFASTHNIAAHYSYQQSSGQSSFSYPVHIAKNQPIRIEQSGMVRANQYSSSLAQGQKTIYSVFASQSIARLVAAIAQTSASDLDLAIYLDNNNNGSIETDTDTKLCISDSSHSHENCSLFNQPAGRYLIEIANLDGSNNDSFTLNWAIINNDQQNFSAQLQALPTGSGNYTLTHNFALNSQPGDSWYGLYTVRNSNDSSVISRTSLDYHHQIIKPSKLSIIAGNYQQTRINNQFAQTIQVRISDHNDQPLAGQFVQFSAPSSGPSAILIGTNPALSDSQGIVSISARTNNIVGNYRIQISSGDLSADLVLNNTLFGQAPDSGSIYLPMVRR